MKDQSFKMSTLLTTSYFLLVLFFLYAVYFIYFQNILHHGDFKLHAGFINDSNVIGYSLLTRGGKVLQSLGLNNLIEVLDQIKILAVVSIFGRWYLTFLIIKKVLRNRNLLEVFFYSSVVMISLNFWGVNTDIWKIERFETALLFFFNDWHNPTVLPANFFTVLLSYILFKTNEDKWELDVRSWLLVIAVIYLGYHFKPSFFSSFTGALFFLLLLFSKYLSRYQIFTYLKLLSISIIIFLLIKWMTPFLTEENIKIKFSFFDFLLNSSRLKNGQSLFFIILNFTFPLILLIQTFYRRKNEDVHIWLLFSLLCLAGFFQPMLLSEPGDRLNHSNFRWSSFSVFAFVAPYSLGLAVNSFKERKAFTSLSCMPFYAYLLCFISGAHWMLKYVILGEFYNE
jgi:hypothetical protein